MEDLDMESRHRRSLAHLFGENLRQWNPEQIRLDTELYIYFKNAYKSNLCSSDVDTGMCQILAKYPNVVSGNFANNVEGRGSEGKEEEEAEYEGEGDGNDEEEEGADSGAESDLSVMSGDFEDGNEYVDSEFEGDAALSLDGYSSAKSSESTSKTSSHSSRASSPRLSFLRSEPFGAGMVNPRKWTTEATKAKIEKKRSKRIAVIRKKLETNSLFLLNRKMPTSHELRVRGNLPDPRDSMIQDMLEAVNRQVRLGQKLEMLKDDANVQVREKLSLRDGVTPQWLADNFYQYFTELEEANQTAANALEQRGIPIPQHQPGRKRKREASQGDRSSERTSQTTPKFASSMPRESSSNARSPLAESARKPKRVASSSRNQRKRVRRIHERVETNNLCLKAGQKPSDYHIKVYRRGIPDQRGPELKKRLEIIRHQVQLGTHLEALQDTNRCAKARAALPTQGQLALNLNKYFRKLKDVSQLVLNALEEQEKQSHSAQMLARSSREATLTAKKPFPQSLSSTQSSSVMPPLSARKEKVEILLYLAGSGAKRMFWNPKQTRDMFFQEVQTLFRSGAVDSVEVHIDGNKPTVDNYGDYEEWEEMCKDLQVVFASDEKKQIHANVHLK
ncbi:hypothetical protein Q7P37_001977 [Cladosporium fusiforme]